MTAKWTFDRSGDRWKMTSPSGQESIYGGYEDASGVFRPARAAIARMYREAQAVLSISFTAAAPPNAERWTALLVPEGVETSDKREIQLGALFWRDPPLPLMLQTETDVGHMGAELAGTISEITRDGSRISGSGPFDNSDAGRQAIQVLLDRDRYGLSVDLGEFEADQVCLKEDAEGDCVDAKLIVTRGEIIGATMTPFPAFAEAYISLDLGKTEPVAAAASPQPLIPIDPPAEWFMNPQLDEPTPLTITDEGEVFGHAASWGTCHIGIHGACVTPPRSRSGYAFFQTGETRVADCDCDGVSTGVITMGTGHADVSSSTTWEIAKGHYDHSGFAVADVAMGEDESGPWFHGALRPGVTPEQIRQLRGAALSGDWRPIGGAQELVALLAVNVPGFPIPRPKVAIAASGAPAALVAAGIVAPRETVVVEVDDEVEGLRVKIAEQAALLDLLKPQMVEGLRARVAAITE